MKTTPAAVLHVQDGVYTVKQDNGCKHLGNGNEKNAVTLPEYTSSCSQTKQLSQGEDLTMVRLNLYLQKQSQCNYSLDSYNEDLTVIVHSAM